MFKKRYGKRAFKKKFTRKFPARKRTFNKTKYGNRRFSKPTYKQTIKYGKLEDMIRNKVVVRKFDHTKAFTSFEKPAEPLDLEIKGSLDTIDIKSFISEYTEFSLTSIVVQYVCVNLILTTAHIDIDSYGAVNNQAFNKTADFLLKYEKVVTAGPNPVKFRQKFVLSATHKYNRTSPWVDVKTFLTSPSGYIDFTTLLPELPYTTAEKLSTSTTSYLGVKVTYTVSCRNYKTDKVGFTGMAGNRAEGFVNVAMAKKDYINRSEASTMIKEQYLNPEKMRIAEQAMEIETSNRG
jgi:hypothetical protein